MIKIHLHAIHDGQQPVGPGVHVDQPLQQDPLGHEAGGHRQRSSTEGADTEGHRGPRHACGKPTEQVEVTQYVQVVPGQDSFLDTVLVWYAIRAFRAAAHPGAMRIDGATDDPPGLRAAVRRLRDDGHAVVCVLPGHDHEADEFECDRELIGVGGRWAVRAL